MLGKEGRTLVGAMCRPPCLDHTRISSVPADKCSLTQEKQEFPSIEPSYRSSVPSNRFYHAPTGEGASETRTTVVRPRSQMSGNDIRSTSAVSEEHTADFEPRTQRAITETMDILFVGIGRYVVHSESGNRYEIDTVVDACTCSDWEDSATPSRCKHLRRVDMEIDAGTVPRPDGRIVPRTSTSPDPRRTVPSPESVTEAEDRISGPIPEFDQYGRSTGAMYWRCETCGREALRRCDLRRAGCGGSGSGK